MTGNALAQRITVVNAAAKPITGVTAGAEEDDRLILASKPHASDLT
jgi:hypothetical protein